MLFPILVGTLSLSAATRPCLPRRAGLTALCAPAPYEATVGPLPGKLRNSLPLLVGPVANGFGRGSRKLGIPTANLPCSLFQDQLAELPCGVYAGWACVRGGVHKCVCNVGFSPTFAGAENPEKIVEAHIMESFDNDFYGEPMRLLLLGFLRPERKFQGVDELLATIRADIAAASEALECSPLVELQVLVAALPPSRDNKPTFTLLDIPAGLTDGLDVGGYEVPDAFGPAPIGFEWGGLF